MICFRILGIFCRKIAKEQEKKSGHIGRRKVGNPRRGVNLRRNVGCLAMARLRGQNGTPRVRHGVATVHREQISDFCYRTPHIHTPIV